MWSWSSANTVGKNYSAKPNVILISKNDIHISEEFLLKIWRWTLIDTFRNESSLAIICSSMSLIFHVRQTICFLVVSVFSIIIWHFFSSSSLSVVFLAASSLRRISWSSSNSLSIFSSVSWVSVWKLTERYKGQTTSLSILESPESHCLFQTLIRSAVWSKVSLKFSNAPSFSFKSCSESLSFSWKRTTKIACHFSVLLIDFIYPFVFDILKIA